MTARHRDRWNWDEQPHPNVLASCLRAMFWSVVVYAAIYIAVILIVR